jgi:hypothetical protein
MGKQVDDDKEKEKGEKAPEKNADHGFQYIAV